MRKASIIVLAVIISGTLVAGVSMLSIFPATTEKTLVVKFYDGNPTIQIPFGFTLTHTYQTSSGSYSSPPPPNWKSPTQITSIKAVIYSDNPYSYRSYDSGYYNARNKINSTSFVITDRNITYGSGTYGGGWHTAVTSYVAKREVFYGYVVFSSADLIKLCDSITAKTKVEEDFVIKVYQAKFVLTVRTADFRQPEPYEISMTMERYVGVVKPLNPNPNPIGEPSPITVDLTEEQKRILQDAGILTTTNPVDVQSDVAQIIIAQLSQDYSLVLIGLVIVIVISGALYYRMVKKKRGG